MPATDDCPELGFSSLAVRAGQTRTHEGEHAEPIFLTSSFVFANAAEAAARFSTGTGNIYSRFTNPTVRMFQERLAALEGGESCIATGSGMAAILATCIAVPSAIAISRYEFPGRNFINGLFLSPIIIPSYTFV